MADLDPTDRVSDTIPPLIVDLDGTLVRSDLLVESGMAWLAAAPQRFLLLPALLNKGKAALKARIAEETALDVMLLPYDDVILQLVKEAKAEGRQVYVASASHQRYVAAVADHIGADGWFASDNSVNLAGDAKARRLVDTFGQGRFDYVGNDHADLPVWAVSRRRVAVHPSASVRRALLTIDPGARIIEPPADGWRPWIKLIRTHQWAKNALIFVPMLTSHQLNMAAIFASIVACVAFCLAASSIYIVNDLVDLEADRKHHSKRFRPLAAGTVPILASVPVAGAFVAAALVIAAAVSWTFLAVLFGYLLLTTAYSFSLKRKMLVDIVALAGLYTVRVLAGAAAISVPVSEWLLGFSMFIFTSLALIKRYVELTARLDADLPDPTNRNYRKSDLGVIAALAAASGFNAVTVFALYISSESVRLLYPHPWLLWLACPLLMYWIGRMILMADRRYLDDDPVLFALRDRNSLLAFVLTGAILLAASAHWG